MRTKKASNNKNKSMKCIFICLILIVFFCESGINAEEDTWKYRTDMPTARGFVSGCVLDSKIYVIGGFPSHFSVTSTVEMYDPSTDKWTRLADMPEGRCGHATCAFEGKIYVFGGTSPDPYSSAQKNVFVYDPSTNTWTQKADMPYANALCGIAVIDDTIYIAGGALSASSSTKSTLMAYDPITESWTRKADMPTSRAWLSACVVDGQIYAIGGGPQDWKQRCYKNVEVYDPSTDTWSRKSDMPTARAAVGSCVVNGMIYATGGFSPVGVFAANEMYDPSTDTWITKSPMQQKRLMPFVGAIEDKMYVTGGSYPGSQGQPVILKTLEEYEAWLGDSLPDFNSDGIIDIQDLQLLIESWGQDDPLCDIAPKPFGDGTVDVLDLELLMSYWGQEADDPTLIAHWALDEAEGDTAYDSVGINDALVTGNPNWLPNEGQLQGAIQLDGIDDCVIANSVLNPARGPFSVFAWIKGGAPGQVVISGPMSANWLCTDTFTGNLMTELRSPGRSGMPLQSQTLITDGNWHRIGLVWDGVSRILYVDDSVVAEDTQNGLESSNDGLYIGCGKNMEAGTYWSGLIDDVRIYDRVVRP